MILKKFRIKIDKMRHVLFFFTVLLSAKASIWNNLNANIAVMEYQPILNGTSSLELVTLNILKYEEVIASILNQTSLDMIIFPEMTLRTNRETAVEITLFETPCLLHMKYPPFFSYLSSIAAKYRTYVVINLSEKEKCDSCSKSEFFYNTNVVFDRNGTIISRYRKYNLFGEAETDRPDSPEIVTFETDFGVNFGIFTCFDILFQSPAKEILEKNVDGVLFLSFWHSELPFLTSLQSQQMWAYTHNAMLFASGASNPLTMTGGSGIYQGSEQTIVSSFIAKGGTEVLLYQSKNGQIPPSASEDIDTLSKEMDDFPLMSDDFLQNYKYSVLDTSKSEIEEQLCYENKLCCSFSIRLKSEPSDGNSYTYLLAAMAGTREYRNFVGAGLEVCAVIACLNSSISSCGQRFPKYEDISWDVTFEQLTIKANFDNDKNKLQFPNSLLSSIRPIDASETEWIAEEFQENGKKLIERSFSIKKPQTRILTFAIYGRNFNQDYFVGSSRSVNGNLVTIVVCIFVSISIFALQK